MDIAELIPDLAPLALRTTVLLPTAGEPGVRESSAGGPLLWPAGEPWPYCAERGHGIPPDDERNPFEAVPMVPVLQLFASDVPELAFPDGADVLQLVWCTLFHADDPESAVLPRLYWRNSAEILAGELLLDAPAPQKGEYDEEFTPEPCTVTPTPVVEYPNYDMPKDAKPVVYPRIEEVEKQFGVYYTDVACALQTKVGGYPAWNQPARWPSCERGHRMDHLLSVTGDGDLDMDMGDCGGVYLFVCRECPGWPYAYRYDC
ncbi:DUF1963 domain-containing protein [Streptomyces sp. 4F14]|uniref:DUF1963 domain-containing protein n=1 Tax=Streptomyces sp. 4F14 TaxID=3394380 RepID=UPI003A878319